MLKKDTRHLILLAIIWIAAVFIVNPVGDFPLNDDFSYGRTVLNLLSLGQLKYDQWLSMTLVSQVLWGAAFCKVFGFSFTILRVSTLVLGFGGLSAIYLLCRELNQTARFSLLATLAFAFNPLFFNLSFCFMSDVPFFAFGAICTLYYVRALKSGAMKWVIWGTCFGLLSTFVRQQGLMFPVSFGVAWFFLKGIGPKNIAAGFWPLLLNLALFLLFSKWLETSQGLPDGYGDFGKLLHRLDWGIFKQMPLRIGVLLVYSGCFLLPIMLLFLPNTVFSLRKISWQTWLMLLVALAFEAFAWQKLPWGNMIYNLGVGPKVLKDGQFFMNIYPSLPQWSINLLKIAAFTAIIPLFFILKKQLPAKLRSQSGQRPIFVFALTNMALYIGFLLLDLHCFDRYFFQILPFLLICFLPSKPKKPGRLATKFSLASLLFLAVFSITTTHDYLSWNRGRWHALEYLTQVKKIAPNQIDGGFEFNGWHKPGPRDSGGGKSWWWVDREDFIVTFGEMDGFTKEKSFAYKRWLPPGVDSIYVLKHN